MLHLPTRTPSLTSPVNPTCKKKDQIWWPQRQLKVIRSIVKLTPNGSAITIHTIRLHKMYSKCTFYSIKSRRLCSKLHQMIINFDLERQTKMACTMKAQHHQFYSKSGTQARWQWLQESVCCLVYPATTETWLLTSPFHSREIRRAVVSQTLQ